jgi:hypothetical protein
MDELFSLAKIRQKKSTRTIGVRARRFQDLRRFFATPW